MTSEPKVYSVEKLDYTASQPGDVYEQLPPFYVFRSHAEQRAKYAAQAWIDEDVKKGAMPGSEVVIEIPTGGYAVMDHQDAEAVVIEFRVVEHDVSPLPPTITVYNSRFSGTTKIADRSWNLGRSRA
jgi:hypothetical protein